MAWVSGKQLTERGILEIEIVQAIREKKLILFDKNGNRRSLITCNLGRTKEGGLIGPVEFDVSFGYFQLEQVNTVWGELHSSLTADERRHYGLLKAERENITEAITATIDAVLHCQKIKSQIVKAEFLNHLDKHFQTLPQSMKDEIWRHLPRKYKKGSGRPPGTANP